MEQSKLTPEQIELGTLVSWQEFDIGDEDTLKFGIGVIVGTKTQDSSERVQVLWANGMKTWTLKELVVPVKM